MDGQERISTGPLEGEVVLSLRHTELGRRILGLNPDAALSELRGGDGPTDLYTDLQNKRPANL